MSDGLTEASRMAREYRRAQETHHLSCRVLEAHLAGHRRALQPEEIQEAVTKLLPECPVDQRTLLFLQLAMQEDDAWDYLCEAAFRHLPRFLRQDDSAYRVLVRLESRDRETWARLILAGLDTEWRKTFVGLSPFVDQRIVTWSERRYHNGIRYAWTLEGMDAAAAEYLLALAKSHNGAFAVTIDTRDQQNPPCERTTFLALPPVESLDQ